MIEWKQRPSGMHAAECGDLTLIAFEGRGNLNFRAIVEIESEPLLDAFDYPTLDAAKSAAEQFAREWIAAQAAALSPGEWTSVLPDAPGGYWYRIPGPDDDSLNPDTWTDVRLKFFTRPALVVSLGCSIQYWSVPVAPPPLPEATDAK